MSEEATQKLYDAMNRFVERPAPKEPAGKKMPFRHWSEYRTDEGWEPMPVHRCLKWMKRLSVPHSKPGEAFWYDTESGGLTPGLQASIEYHKREGNW